MNVASFANRLVRDLKVKSITELTADARQELQDAINGSLQRLHDLSPDHSKQGLASLVIGAPQTVTIEVEKGSKNIGLHVFTADFFYCSIRISGDSIDNQIIGETTLHHPYGGESGTMEAVVFHDAITIPESFAEIVSDPLVIETGTHLHNSRDNPWTHTGMRKNIGRPTSYWMESNARNQNPPTGPVVMRFGSYPDRLYRLEAEAVFAPARINFSDLLTTHAIIPLRDEHVESYLLPIARASLTESSLWDDKEKIQRVKDSGKDAEARYAILIPQYPATPTHRIRTRRGY